MHSAIPGSRSMNVVIDGAHLWSEGAFRVGTVRIAGPTIDAVAWTTDDRSALCRSTPDVVDGRERWLVPGFVNAHTHSYGSLLRGTESALPLELWSLYTIAYGRAFDDEAIAAAVLLHDIECIRSGITGLVDHFPHVEHARVALAAHERSGLRVLFAPFVQDLSDYDLLDLDVPSELRALTAVAPVEPRVYERNFAQWIAAAAQGSGRVRVALGPNAPQRCSPMIWSLWREIRDDYGIPVHTHALETRAQAHLARSEWPNGMIAAMEEARLLDDRLSLAHAIWTTDTDRECLARYGVTVVHNPISNLTLGSGVMPLRAYLEAGVPVALGSDAANCGGRHDLLEAMRVALTLPRVHDTDPERWPRADEILRFATVNGMHVLGVPTPGDIARNAPADLVLVRRDTASMLPFADTAAAFVAHAGRDAIDAVMVAGRWVMRDGRVLTIDEPRLLATAREARDAVAERVAAKLAEIENGMPSVAAALRRFDERLTVG